MPVIDITTTSDISSYPTNGFPLNTFTRLEQAELELGAPEDSGKDWFGRRQLLLSFLLPIPSVAAEPWKTVTVNSALLTMVASRTISALASGSKIYTGLMNGDGGFFRNGYIRSGVQYNDFPNVQWQLEEVASFTAGTIAAPASIANTGIPNPAFGPVVAMIGGGDTTTTPARPDTAKLGLSVQGTEDGIVQLGFIAASSALLGKFEVYVRLDNNTGADYSGLTLHCSVGEVADQNIEFDGWVGTQTSFGTIASMDLGDVGTSPGNTEIFTFTVNPSNRTTTAGEAYRVNLWIQGGPLADTDNLLFEGRASDNANVEAVADHRMRTGGTENASGYLGNPAYWHSAGMPWLGSNVKNAAPNTPYNYRTRISLEASIPATTIDTDYLIGDATYSPDVEHTNFMDMIRDWVDESWYLEGEHIALGLQVFDIDTDSADQLLYFHSLENVSTENAPTLTIDYDVTVNASAELVSSSSLDAAGTRVALGEAELVGSSALDADALRTAFGLLEMIATSSLDAAALRVAVGAAELIATSVLDADQRQALVGFVVLLCDGIMEVEVAAALIDATVEDVVEDVALGDVVADVEISAADVAVAVPDALIDVEINRDALAGLVVQLSDLAIDATVAVALIDAALADTEADVVLGAVVADVAIEDVAAAVVIPAAMIDVELNRDLLGGPAGGEPCPS